MKILFMGTPDFALEILKSIYEAGETVVGVVTQPDKPKGRGYAMVAPPVKVYAEEKGLPVFQPETMKNEAFLPTLRELDPEMIVVAAYGKILPAYIINYPKYGCINAHGSILPEYRGAAPIQRAIMDGKRESGVCAMYMDEGLDTGDVIFVEKTDITDDDTFETLHDKLAVCGSKAILRTIEAAKCGCIPREKQDGEKATYAAKILKEDRIIDFGASACCVCNKIRGLYPFPRAFTYLPDGKMLQITSACVCCNRKSDAAPGMVISADAEGFAVACGEGVVLVKEVIPEGKGKMKAADFVRGRKIAEGDVLGKKD